MKVGIPRALLFHEYSLLWITFFEEIGAQVVVSDKSNKKILDEGINITVDEACLPIKLFHGHVLDIKDKVDYLFIPRLKSLYRGEFTCPKICGLPEMIRHSIGGLPKIIDIEVDLSKSPKKLKEVVYRIGRYFTNNKRVINSAYNRAYIKYKNHRISIKNKSTYDKTIMILGHPYTLYDNYLNINIFDKVITQGINTLTPEMIDGDLIDCYANEFENKLYWTFGRKLVGSTLYITDKGNVDGIIYISTFGCGLDSVIVNMIERKVRRNTNIPITIITLDEHSGEAGINTRIEAFIDMIKWRERYENNISTYG